MRGTFLLLALGGMLLLFTSSPILAEEQKWKLVIELDDSSRLVGEPEQNMLLWQTPEGEREIPLQTSLSATLEKETWTAQTGNKDFPKFSGKILTPALRLKTLVGTVTVPMKHAVRIDVYRTYDQIALPHPEDLVFYLSFDENQGEQVRNVASFRHQGTVKGAEWIPNGRRGGAYQFDGKGTIEIPHHEDLCPKTFTLSAWIKPDDPVGPWRLVMSKTHPGSWYDGFGFYRHYNDDENLYWYAGKYYSAAAKDPITRGEWVHIAGVYDGKQVQMFLNGEPSVAVPVNYQNTPLQHTTTPFIIGGGSGYNWIGQIDEVMFFRRALTPAEVEKLMMLGMPDEQE